MAGLTTNVAGFSAGLDKLQSSPRPHLVVFTADPDPRTGAPWCPDCVRSVPAVKKVVEEYGGTVLEVQVGPPAVWKNRSHPFRVDPQLKLTGIPTLIQWMDEGPGARLGSELERAFSPVEAVALVAQFMKRIGAVQAS